jgi:hypothetical protein
MTPDAVHGRSGRPRRRRVGAGSRPDGRLPHPPPPPIGRVTAPVRPAG